MLSLDVPRTGVACLIALVAAGWTAGCVDIAAQYDGIVDRVEHRFETAGVPIINLETFDGRISVATWNRPEVLVVVEKHATDKEGADRMHVSATQNGDRVDVVVRAQGPRRVGFRYGPFSARLLVVAPVRASLTASSGDGRVEVVDLEGDVDVRTGDGAIRIAGVTGAVSAQSGDGSIVVDGRLLGLRLRSGDGRLTVHAQEGSAAPAAWSLSTGDGSVAVELPQVFNAELDAHTGGGRIRVSDVAFDTRSTLPARRDLQGRIGSGGQELRIRSGDGSITVRGISR